MPNAEWATNGAAPLHQIAGGRRGSLLYRLDGFPVAPIANGLSDLLDLARLLLCVGSGWTFAVDQLCPGNGIAREGRTTS